jgi:hypothetical protein
MSDAQKSAESQGNTGAKSATAAGGILGKKKPAVSAPATAAPAGGLVGAVKNDIQNPASMIHGGKDLISKDSMKGKALSEDPQANLASKRSSEYRKVFQARGAAGKHSWGK